jgi:hypothetical protein
MLPSRLVQIWYTKNRDHNPMILKEVIRCGEGDLNPHNLAIASTSS